MARNRKDEKAEKISKRDKRLNGAISAIAKGDLSREGRIAKMCDTINKGEHGGANKDAMTWLGSREVKKLERFPSGSPELDDALGGGWPVGRFIEIYGPESGGKSTMCLHAIAEFQRLFPDDDVALIDTEYSFDEEYAANVGVNTRWLMVHQPDNGTQALNVLEELIKLGVRLIVVDSVAALTTKEEMDGNLGDAQVAEQARLMSRALRRLTGEAGKRQTTVFWTNQLREKIGVTYGDTTTTPAGRALKHYASIRVGIRRVATEKEKIDGVEVPIANDTRADVKKNKCVASGEVLYLPGRGCFSVDDLCGEKGFPVMSFDGQHFQESPAEGCYKQRVEPCVEVKVRSIGSSFVNLDHPFLTPSGYVRAGDLESGDLIACADCLPSVVDKDSYWTPKRATLAGLLAGDGWVGGTTGVALRNFSDGCVERFRDAVDEFECSIYEKEDQKGLWVVRGVGSGTENKLYSFLKDIGMWGSRAWDKKVPDSLFQGTPSCRWAFIGGLLASDGWATDKCVGLQVTSKLLAEGVRNLLLTCGVRSSVSRRRPRKGGRVDGRRIVGKRMSYVVRVRHLDGLKRIADNVPWADGKLDGDFACQVSVGSRVPIEWADAAIKSANAKGVTPKRFMEERGFGRPRGGWKVALGMKRRTGTASRERVLQLALDADEKEVYDLCMSSVEWHAVTAVVAAGDRLTYDIAGTGWENFLLNGMVTHNTAPPFRTARFYISYGRGIDPVVSKFDAGVKRKVIAKRGNWYYFEEDQIAQGRYNSIVFLQQNEEFFKKVGAAVDEAVRNKTPVVPEPEKRPIKKPSTSKGKDGAVEVSDV